jgi:hypothetical protein
MLIYTDNLSTADVRAAFAESLDQGVYLELHGPMKSRKRARRFVVKLSADPGYDRWGTKRRWANSGTRGAATPNNGYAGEPIGEKATTFDEWGVFIAALFDRDPGAIVGQYDSPGELRRAWTEPVIA